MDKICSWPYSDRLGCICLQTTYSIARLGGAEVAGWTLDRKIPVRFPAYPHRVWALWWQGGKRRLRTSRCPCRGRLGTLKTPSCPWCGCPAAGQNLETGHLSRHYIAEISLNVTLNHNQHQQQNIPSITKPVVVVCRWSIGQLALEAQCRWNFYGKGLYKNSDTFGGCCFGFECFVLDLLYL